MFRQAVAPGDPRGGLRRGPGGEALRAGAGLQRDGGQRREQIVYHWELQERCGARPFTTSEVI